MKKLEKIAKVIIVAAILTGFYVAWTHSATPGNLLVISIAALLTAAFFTGNDALPTVTPKKIAYSIVYIGYMVIAIIRSTLDVAGRIIKKNIPLNPGIVKVKTKLKSKAGRMVLANSITLTPGTLSVDVKDDFYYIHWIDITAKDVEGASKEIVAGFEKYLEVIFG